MKRRSRKNEELRKERDEIMQRATWMRDKCKLLGAKQLNDLAEEAQTVADLLKLMAFAAERRGW